MAQSVQSLEPPWLNVPAGQARHAVERAVALYIPAGQSTHVLLISYRPAAQSAHAPETGTAPEAHGGLCWADAAGAMMSATAATTRPRFPRGRFAVDGAIAEDAMPGKGRSERRAGQSCAPTAVGPLVVCRESKCRDWRVQKG